MSVYSMTGNELELVWAQDGTAPIDVYDLAGQRAGPGKAFYDIALLHALPNAFSFPGAKQGGCTDGTYIYQTSGDFSTYWDLLKYRISDGTLTSRHYEASGVDFGHCNDVTYDPVEKVIWIGTMRRDGSVIAVDPEDLSVLRTVYLKNGSGESFAVWQFAFDRLSGHFLVAVDGAILVYDRNWNYLREIPIPDKIDATAQGGETDGTYFYRLTYDPNGVEIIRLADGARAKVVSILVSGEPEAICYDWAGHWYMSRNLTAEIVHEIEMYEEEST